MICTELITFIFILSCDVIDSSMGSMEETIEEFRLQSGVSVKESLSTARVRVLTTGIVMAMQVLRLRTLQALAYDWQCAYDEVSCTSNSDDSRYGGGDSRTYTQQNR